LVDRGPYRRRLARTAAPFAAATAIAVALAADVVSLSIPCRLG
jgi:hypothetical protein